MNSTPHRLSSFLLLLLVLLLSGCGSPQVRLNLSSTANLNMNDNKEPLPVVVRIYQLSDSKAFETATFSELWKSDITILGNSLLRKDSLTLDPSSQQKISLDRHEETRFVAVMAAFRNQPNDSWRTIKKSDGSIMGLKLSTSLKVTLKDNVIEIVE
jgi:type VI secretion system protein VasD